MLKLSSGAKAAGQRIKAVLATLLLASSIGEAKSVSFGLDIGVPLNHLATAESGMVATTGRFTLGPSLQVSLPRHFGLEADLLYKRLRFGLGSEPARLTVHRLELPLQLRYVFQSSHLRPFVHAGLSFDRAIAVSGSSACAEAIAGKGSYCIGGKAAVQLRHRHTHGFVLGAGMDFRRGKLRLAPEIRATRWVDRNFGTQDSLLRSNLMQIELLLGLKF